MSLFQIVPETIEKRLKFISRIADALFTIGVLYYVFRSKLNLDNFFHHPDDYQSVQPYVDLLFACAMSMATLSVFVLWRYYSRKELEVASELFSKSRTPQKWDALYGGSLIYILTVIFYVIFLILALNVDNMKVFCPAITVLYVISLISHFLRRKNLTTYFCDHRYTPPDYDPHSNFISLRRSVAAKYVLGYRHITKEALIIAFLLLATIISVRVNPSDHVLLGRLPEIIVLSVLVANEITLLNWRRDRDAELDHINALQTQADQQRLNE